MSKIPNNKNNITSKKSISNKESNLVKKPFIDKDKIEKMSQERILQKNVVYVIGLSYKLARKEILQKNEYFGQYGTILKILTNKTKGFNQNSYYENCYSSYIYYSSPIEASLAILAVDNFKIENHYLKTSFGRTKYCSFFLRNLECLNKDCYYLHKLAEKDDVITADDSKLLFHEQHIQAIKISNISDSNFKKKIFAEDGKNKFDTVFPKISAIYSKSVIVDHINEINSGNGNNSNGNFNNNLVTNSNNVGKNGNIINDDSKNMCGGKNLNCEKNNEKILNLDENENMNGINGEKYNKGQLNEDKYENDQNIEKKEKTKKNEENRENIKNLKLSDILKNEKKNINHSPPKIGLADLFNKKTKNDRKTSLNINVELKDDNKNLNLIKSISNNDDLNKKISIKKEQNFNSFNSKTNDLINLNDILSYNTKNEDNLININSITNNNENININFNGSHKYFEENKGFSEKSFKKFSESSYSSNSENHNNITNNLNNSVNSKDYKSENNENINGIDLKNNDLNKFSSRNSFLANDEINLIKSHSSIENPTDFNVYSSKLTEICNVTSINLNENKNEPAEKILGNNPKTNHNRILFKNDSFSSNKNISKTNTGIIKKISSKSKQEILNDVSKNFITDLTNYSEKSKTNPKSVRLEGSQQNNNAPNNKIENIQQNFQLNDTNKSDPRSSIISSTSCSVSPNISYNQETDNGNSNNYSNNNLNTITPEKPTQRKSLYTKRDMSRFDFVLNLNNINEKNEKKSEENNKIDEEIPDFVFDVLNKKISRFSFFKRFENEYDVSDSIFLEKQLLNKDEYKDDSWANFLKMNLYP